MQLKEIIKKFILGSPSVTKKKGRFNYVGESYKFDRVIFNVTMVFIILALVYVFSTYGFDFSPRIYFKCRETTEPCINPFYKGPIPLGTYEIIEPKYKEACTYDWCNDQYLPPGFEGGEKPTWLYDNIGKICWSLFILALLLNHFLYNRGTIMRALKETSEED